MTTLELENAKYNFTMETEGRKQMLECLNSYHAKKFTDHYLKGITKESIEKITEEEMLREIFLTEFQKTKNSSEIMVFLNQIQRTNGNINDGQPELISIDHQKSPDYIPSSLNIYRLYCDLETNKPVLVDEKEHYEYYSTHDIIYLPDYTPIAETYLFNSKSLNQISKGSATVSFNRLQLYYFRELLTSSYEEAITKVRKLKKEELEKICLSK